jgi:hypothetical protein
MGMHSLLGARQVEGVSFATPGRDGIAALFGCTLLSQKLDS